MILCRVVLVASCVVLFLLCVFVRDLFLFVHTILVMAISFEPELGLHKILFYFKAFVSER